MIAIDIYFRGLVFSGIYEENEEVEDLDWFFDNQIPIEKSSRRCESMHIHQVRELIELADRKDILGFYIDLYSRENRIFAVAVQNGYCLSVIDVSQAPRVVQSVVSDTMLSGLLVLMQSGGGALMRLDPQPKSPLGRLVIKVLDSKEFFDIPITPPVSSAEFITEATTNGISFEKSDGSFFYTHPNNISSIKFTP